jgi:dihydroorotase
MAKIIIPSPIDVHAHLRQSNHTKPASETIRSGTAAALAGGYQAVFDMPNSPNAPTWTAERLRDKIAVASTETATDVGFDAGVDLDNPAFDEFPTMIAAGAAGLKIYMGLTTGNTKEQDLDVARPAIDAWMAAAKKAKRRCPILLHARENTGAETAEYIASQNHAVHWCHISTASETKMAKKLISKFGQFFTAGVTPHHLTMTWRNSDFQQGWNARMQPPLGDETDTSALLDAYRRGVIQILETDHAPHIMDNKLAAERDNPTGVLDPNHTTCFGVSGIEFVVPIMLGLVARGLVDQARLVDSLYDQPLAMLGLSKDQFSAQTVLETGPYVIGEKDFVGQSRNTPYIGWMAGARVVEVKRDHAPKVIQ